MTKKFFCLILAFLFCLGVFPVGIFENEEVYAAESNEEIIFKFLVNEVGLNTAAACGVLANIEKESGFVADKKEKGYTWEEGAGYGICQWTNSPRTNPNGRREKMINWCTKNGYDYKSLIGQLNYLKYELSTSYYYKFVTSKLLKVENSAQGAYDAGYYWCYYYEVPANYKNVSVTRGNSAKNKYWPKYKDYFAPSYADVGTNFYAYIKSVSNGLFATSDGETNGANVCLRAETGAQNQIWYFEKLSDGSYSVKNAKNMTMCLDVAGAKNTAGTNVQIWPYNGNNAQKWFLEGKDNKYIFKSQCAETVLDVNGNSSLEGTNLQMWTKHGGVAQQFSLIKLDSGNARYYFDVNGILDGSRENSTTNYGTFDVYVNGKQAANDVSDFYQRLSYRSTYEIKDIKSATGKGYVGVAEGSIKGTITGETKTHLQFGTLYKLDTNVILGDEYIMDASNFVSFDVKVNGKVVKTNVGDYWTDHPNGSEYEILNIAPVSGYELVKEKCSNLSGTIKGKTEAIIALKVDIPRVIYDANGGENAPSDSIITIERGDGIVFLSSTVPTRAGYKFIGWATVPENPQTIYGSGSVYFANKTLTMYAQWEKCEVKDVNITALPSKTEYACGEKFDPSGLKLTVTYSDGTTETITDGFTVTGFDSNTEGTKEVTVKYAEQRFTFQVTILPKTETEPEKPETECLLGDVNRNGAVDAADATQLLRNINGKASLIDRMTKEEISSICDIDGNGSVTASDATQILRHINGKTSRFDQYVK